MQPGGGGRHGARGCPSEITLSRGSGSAWPRGWSTGWKALSRGLSGAPRDRSAPGPTGDRTATKRPPLSALGSGVDVIKALRHLGPDLWYHALTCAIGKAVDPMNMQVQGKIHAAFDAEQVTQRFRKREFVLELEGNPAIPSTSCSSSPGTAARCSTATKGDEVKVEFSLRGREWTSPKGEVRYFNSLETWSIDRVGDARRPRAGTTTRACLPTNRRRRRTTTTFPFRWSALRAPLDAPLRRRRLLR